MINATGYGRRSPCITACEMNGDACRRSSSISDGVRFLPPAVMMSYMRPDLLQLEQLRRVLAEDRDRPGVAEHPFALLWAVGGVDRHDDCPGRGAGELDLHPLRAGAGEDADAVTRLDPQADKPARDFLGDRAQLGVGQVLPGAAALEPLPGTIADVRAPSAATCASV